MIKIINAHFYKIVLISFSFALAIVVLPFFSDWTFNQEAFIYSPEDGSTFFSQAKSSIELSHKKDDEYVVRFSLASETNKPASLRRDMSLLFENGIFVSAIKQSLREQIFIEEVGTYDGEDSGRYDALTFHHAEIHHLDEQINSKYTWSSDQLYVTGSPFSQLSSFSEATDQNESKSKDILDSVIDQQGSNELEKLVTEFQIDKNDYYVFSLLELPNYKHIPLPGLTEQETYAAIGKLWEDLYRYYILGIDTFTEETYSPVGNSIPHILLHKDGTHLLLLYRTKDGSKQQLLQLIRKFEDTATQTEDERIRSNSSSSSW